MNPLNYVLLLSGCLTSLAYATAPKSTVLHVQSQPVHRELGVEEDYFGMDAEVYDVSFGAPFSGSVSKMNSHHPETLKKEHTGLSGHPDSSHGELDSQGHGAHASQESDHAPSIAPHRP